MWKFLYFSCTAMTTTGYGDITPRLMIGRIAVIVHMLVSQIYHILILGLGTALLVSRQRESEVRNASGNFDHGGTMDDRYLWNTAQEMTTPLENDEWLTR